jgi:vacuolar-type H+-ATPase subunit I/STV1
MTSEQKPRYFYITRDEGSTDRDNLTHIVLFEYHADKDPLKVVDAKALEQAKARIKELEAEESTYSSAMIETRNTASGVIATLREENAKLKAQLEDAVKALEYSLSICDSTYVIISESPATSNWTVMIETLEKCLKQQREALAKIKG